MTDPQQIYAILYIQYKTKFMKLQQVYDKHLHLCAPVFC
jgi:hypothetical protein